MEDTIIEDVLKTSESFYNKKDYPNALLILQKHKNELSPGVWNYNVGTILAKMDRLSEARFHFILASKSGFNTEELLSNKTLVEEKLEVSRLEKPLETSDYLVKTMLFLSDGIFTSLSLLILLTGLWVLRKKANLKKILLFLVPVLIPIGLNFWVRSWPLAIVSKVQLLRDGPSAIFESRGEVPPGILVIASGDGEWKKISYPSRFQGWIKNEGLLELEQK